MKKQSIYLEIIGVQMIMKDIDILNVSKPFFQYKCDDADTISQKGFFSFEINHELEEFEEGEFEAVLEFKMKIFDIDDSLHTLAPEEIREKDSNALFHAKYKVIFYTDLSYEDITQKKILIALEAYIKKDVLEFYKEVELPVIQLPKKIWIENQDDETL